MLHGRDADRLSLPARPLCPRALAEIGSVCRIFWSPISEDQKHACPDCRPQVPHGTLVADRRSELEENVPLFRPHRVRRSRKSAAVITAGPRGKKWASDDVARVGRFHREPDSQRDQQARTGLFFSNPTPPSRSAAELLLFPAFGAMMVNKGKARGHSDRSKWDEAHDRLPSPSGFWQKNRSCCWGLLSLAGAALWWLCCG